jgi:hypothetical protein
MGKVFDLNSGSGSTGNPCVIYLLALLDSEETWRTLTKRYSTGNVGLAGILT